MRPVLQMTAFGAPVDPEVRALVASGFGELAFGVRGRARVRLERSPVGSGADLDRRPRKAQVTGRVQVRKKLEPRRRNEEYIAVHAADIRRQLRSPTRRVHPDYRDAGQCRSSEEEEVLGDVVGEHTDVQGLVPWVLARTDSRARLTRVAPEQRGADGAFADELVPRPAFPLEKQPGPMVAEPGEKHVTERRMAHLVPGIEVRHAGPR